MNITSDTLVLVSTIIGAALTIILVVVGGGYFISTSANQRITDTIGHFDKKMSNMTNSIITIERDVGAIKTDVAVLKSKQVNIIAKNKSGDNMSCHFTNQLAMNHPVCFLSK